MFCVYVYKACHVIHFSYIVGGRVSGGDAFAGRLIPRVPRLLLLQHALVGKVRRPLFVAVVRYTVVRVSVVDQHTQLLHERGPQHDGRRSRCAVVEAHRVDGAEVERGAHVGTLEPVAEGTDAAARPAVPERKTERRGETRERNGEETLLR